MAATSVPPIATVAPADLRIERYARGQTHHLRLAPCASRGVDVEMPVVLVRGARPGPRLTVTAAVHGDEYEGVIAILQTVHELQPHDMQGDLLAVPVVHAPAFWAGARTSPLDGADLARTCPGRADGSATEQIAWHLGREVIAPSDFYLDLHSGGSQLAMPCLVGYAADDPRSARAARAFGARVIWAHRRVSPGRTISVAGALGIPWLYTEARGGGAVDPEELRIVRRGIVNLMRHLGMLAGDPEVDGDPLALFGDGDIDRALHATQRGVLVSHVGLLDPVAAGQPIGTLLDLHGRAIETIRAPRTGRVALVRHCPMVQPGQPLFFIADVDPGAGAVPSPSLTREIA